MSDELKKNNTNSESGAPITPGANKGNGENGQNATIQQDRDYQKLVEKSLEEQITDTQISRADITNPNLHYGTPEDLEQIDAHIPEDEEQSAPKLSETEVEDQPEAKTEAEARDETAPQSKFYSTNPPKGPGTESVVKPPADETPPPTETQEPPENETPDPDPDPRDEPKDPDPNPGGDPTPTYDPDLVATGDTIDENAAEGTVVATLDLTGAAGSTYTYAITDADGNPVADPNFAIDGNEIVVAPFANIDYESNPTHTFFVTGRDNAGNTVTEQITVTVNDVNEFDVSPISDIDASDNSVAEGASVGDSVGITAFASDADGTNNGVTYSLSDDAGGLFAIDPETGEVTVAGALDYESATSHVIEVTATSEDGSTSTQSFTIGVTDEDEFDVSPISDTDSTDNQVSEGANIGDSVGITAFASDADGTNNGVTYSLSDDAGGLFAIDPETGEVTVAGALDYESATSHVIEVTATSEDGSTSTQSFTIGVTDEDEFDVSPISDTDSTDNQVSEGANIGDSVGITAFASDADGTNNGVTYSLSDDAGGLFAIDPETGEVTVAGPLDYESATSHVIEVTATSEDGSTSVQSFTIGVTDEDEFDVSAIRDADTASNEVDEDASVGDVVGITALATDADGSNNSVTYSLSDDAGGLFTIDPNTGVVTVAGPLDHETATSHNITVVATSEDGSTSDETFTISVNDVNETAISAISDADSSDNTVSEGASLGTAVGITALATDADATDTVTYSLSSNPGGFFAIDANTGEVTVANDLDYESAQAHVIEITATSSDGSVSTEAFTIDVTDEDEFDVSPISDTDSSDNQVAEGASVGDSVGITAFASDADGTNNGVTYSLSDDAGGLFAIDPETGEVTVAGALDYESATSHVIEVTATSEDGSTSVQSFTIGVTDEDEFDVSAISDTDASDNSVAEGASVGDSVGITAFASDADGTNNGVTYSLSDDAGGLFAIDPETGEVTVAGALDYESATSHVIEVTATSEDGSTSVQSFTIGVTDEDEFDVSAISDTDASDNSVAEGASVGDSVGITAFASDADGTNNGVTYSLSDDAGGLFAIDPETGEVTVAGPLDYESATSHVIEVTATSEDGSTSTQTFSIGVTDEDEFDVSPISDTDSSDNSVAEGASVGDSVGITAFASDADGTNNGVTYSLSDDAGGLFAIDPETGEVTVAGALDYESATSHVIEVTATSEDGSTSTQSFTIGVTDEDEFDVSPISDTDSTDNQVSEGANIGDSVGITAFASDADGTNNGVTYSLSDDAGGLFAIDPETGEVTVAGPLDYESATSHVIEVTATSEDGSTSVQSFTIGVTDEDEFDVSAIRDADTASNEVDEDASVGDVVGITALATDADGSNNSVTYSLSDDAGGLFTIDPNTGVVTVAGPLDHETATSHNITVVATSEDGSTSDETFTISVNDVNETAISAISDADSSDNTVSEGASLGTAVGITALATDADATDTVTYSLSSNPGGFFAIDANTGEVTVANDLDYESAQAHVIEITATSSDGSVSTEAFTIDVTDEDEFDVSPISDTDSSDNQVAEGASVGDSVGITAFASDADGTNNGVTYSLSDDAGGLFAIDPETGEVTVAGALDYESATSHVIEVTATSEDGSTSVQSFTIGVTDEDEFDVSAISDTDASDNSVAEGASVGDSVGITAFASDADGTNNGVTYSLSDDAGGLFAIDPETGEVTVAGALDYESATSHVIEVTATSEDGSTSVQSFTIGVTDEDEFDVSAIRDADTASNEVDEDASVGDVVGITALATDADGSNNSVTYSLSDDAGGLFTIDPNTGVVTVAGPLDHETATSHNITVVATSEDGSTSDETFTISVNDVNETAISAISDADSSDNTVSEGASLGTAVGITALATDADATDTVTYSLSSNPGGFFAIDANTGEVTVANDLDYESAQAHVIEITATSSDGSVSTEAFTIDVTDEDEFDVSPISDTDSSDNQVAEGASVGDSVGITAFASDADGTNNGVTYSLSDDAGGLFAIDPETGEVTVAGALDYESATSHVIEVTATSEDGSTSVQSFTIGVTDEDEFDVSAISDTDASDNSVAEGASVGDSVGITAFASDADGTNNGVTYSLSDDAGGLFAIDPETGEVTVAGALDYESATSHVIEVTATSEDGSTSVQSFTIGVTDEDEFDVSAISDTDASDNSVAEGASVGDSVGITAFASDADGTNNGVTYSLSDDAGGLFAIDPETGEVTVAGPLDYESATSHVIEVTATSEDGSTSTQTFSIGVTDEDEFDVSPISDTDSSDNSVAEGASVGDSVGITAFASDADGTNNGVTYSLSDDAGGLFAIDPETGEVTVAGALDYESATSHVIEVTATSEDGSTSTQSFTIGVTDEDEFDVSPISDTDSTDNQVSEGANIGDSVGITAFASDADGTNNGVTYSLSDDAGGLFAIDPETGEVTVAGPLDYESATSHVIEVTATSEDGSTSVQSFTIGVTDEDEFDVSAIRDADTASNEVDEDASVGDVVGITALATDADGSNNSVTYSLSDDAGGLFTIDPNTGVVTVAGPLDHETATSHNITVVATSEDGSTSDETFTISVNDVNETAISAISDADSSDNTVSEGASLGTAVGITALATDADATDTVTYSLSSNPGGFFAIDANTGEVTVANDLDYESAQAHVIEITATSSDGSVSTEAFTIDVTDEDEFDVSPISDTDSSDNQVAEGASVGDSVGITAFASDADGTNNGVTYSLSDDAGGLFAIDPETGEVTVAGALDYESATSHVIEVTATSEDGSTSTQSFTIGVTDEDEFDVSPISDTDSTDNQVSEGANIGDSVGITAFASDADGTNNGVTYSLSDDAGGLFAIDPETGEVTVAGPLDYESATSHVIEVTATSEDGSTSVQSFTIGVTDEDEFDVSAIRDADTASNEVDEDASVGDVVGITALATDADGSNNSVTYSLSDDAGGLFTIDPNTGVVTVAGPLDHETATSHNITVVATSEDGSTSDETFTISVNDVNETAISAISDADSSDNTVSEGASLGTAVGITALATDADATDTVTYSLSSNPGGFFAIDANTGEVTVANDLDYESAQAHVIEITATSSDGSVSTEAFTIDVTDEDEFDVSPISDTDSSDNQVAEGASVGDSVGITAFASDADGTNNGVTYSLSDDAGGLFAIDPETGEVTVAGALDYESATSHVIEVTATSEDGSTSTQSFTIGVTDEDEFDVSPISDTDSTDNQVSEGANIGDSVGITAFASDADGTNNGVTYSLSDDAGGLFAIDPETGEVTVAGPLDYESATSHVIEVTATSEDGSTSVQSFTIGVTDEDEFDVSAIRDADTASNEVDEDASVGDVVGITALATDADGSNNSVTYSLSDDAGGLFTIDPNTGVVTVAGPLDHETATSHNITVVATSEDGSTSDETFTISVNDVNETAISAISDADSSDNTVSEGASLGTAVGITALATDADATDTVTYSLSSNPGGFFAIDANTGEVTVANDLDYESAQAHVIEITATSSDGSVSTEAFTIDVTDEDEFDVSPISDTDSSDNQVAEGASVGDSVGITAFASDADGTNNGVTYSLSDDAGGLFAIDPETGEVTVAGALDYESATSHVIEVTATSEDGSTSTQSFTIGVTDEDEFDVSPISDTDSTDNQVSEGANIGDSVGITAFASDADGTNNGVTYSLSDDAGGLFAIDPETGEVTVAGPLDYESATSHVIEVTATSEDGSTSVQSFTIGVTDEDEFDVSAIRDADTASNEVDEDASVGDVVGITALATDADGSNNSVTYSLSDDAGGLFTIDPNTGVVTVAGPLDHETATSHNITVVATSEDGSTSDETFTISVNDVNETAISAISDADSSDNTVSEGASLGTAVGITALATDADATDTVTYSLSSNPGGFFAIDANTGEVTVANDLDYESAQAHVIEITATSSDGSVSTEAFTIDVTDEDEFDVSPISDTDSSDNTVSEGASLGTAVGITAFASDADGTNNGVTYSLSDDAGGLFAIDPETGEVTVAGPLDYESATSHVIEVTATSEDGSTSVQSFTIGVTDENEAPDARDINMGATNEDTSFTFSQAQLLSNSSDPDADAKLEVTSLRLNDDAHGTLVDNGDGTWTFTPTEDLAVEDVAFDFTISDGTYTDSATATLDVIAEADDPTLNLSTTRTEVLSSNDSLESGFEGDFASIGATNNNGFIGSIGDWQTDSDAIEVKTETLSDGSTNSYIELNDDRIDYYEDATNIYQMVETTDGGTYTVDFNFAPRPGFDSSVNTIEVLVDGVVVETISADGTGDRAINWQSQSITFEGDGTPMKVEFREAGEDQNYGRGMYMDNISITEELPEGVIHGDENTAIALPDISASTNDSDGSETLSLTISNLPDGAVLSDGTNTFTATAGDSVADITDWQLDSITITPPSEYSGEMDISVNATSTDGRDQNTVSEIITVIVDDDDDNFEGTSSEDIYEGGAGNDTLNGNSGNDWLSGGEGDDTLNGGNGDDILIGGAGNDTIDGGRGADTVVFSGDLDDYEIVEHPDGYYIISDLRPGSPDGVDTVDNVEAFQFADQTVEVGDMTPTREYDPDQYRDDYTGVDETDDRSDSTQNEFILGSALNDLLIGGSGDDYIDAGAGDDDAAGRGGDDEIHGGDGNDVILGGTGDDTISGDGDNDSIDGGSGTDTAQYSGNRDEYTVYRNDDGSFTIIDDRPGSPDGTDTVINVEFFEFADVTLSAEELLIEDADSDENAVDENSAVGTSVGFTAFATDTVRYSLSDDSGGLFAINEETGEVTVAGKLDYESADSHTIEVTALDSNGVESVRAYTINVNDLKEENTDTVKYQEDTADNDKQGDSGSQTNWGTRGDDTTYGGEGNDTLGGGEGNDTLWGGSDNDQLHGNAGNDELHGGSGDDTIYGHDDNDTIHGDAGDDRLYGGAGNDEIHGGSGNDEVYGGSGDDIIRGGTGDDRLYGEDGNDLFIFQMGDGHDTISGGSGSSWTDTIQLMDQDGGSDIGTFGEDWTLTLDSGSIDSINEDSIDLSDDASGTINLSDGSTIDFSEIERIDW